MNPTKEQPFFPSTGEQRTLKERLKTAGYEVRNSAQYQKAVYKRGVKLFEGFALDISRWLDKHGVPQ